MTWFIEHLHRDGSVLARIAVPEKINIGGQLTIGRALDNDLILDDPHCASHHARLEIDGAGHARLLDLGSQNGVINRRKQRTDTHAIQDDAPYRIGNSLIRVRASHWPISAEQTLSRRAIWPLALVALLLVLGHSAWQLWLTDVQQKSPPYLYGLSSIAFVLCLWSAMYTLFGRLVSGAERFFAHLFIATCGYLSGTIILSSLDMLAFAMSWLWPIRITEPVIVIVTALTVRSHLRLADPRHWPTLRIGLGIVASLAIVVPIAQNWVSNQRLTNIQTINHLEHPALMIKKPISPSSFSQQAAALKAKVETARQRDSDHDDDDDADLETDTAP